MSFLELFAGTLPALLTVLALLIIQRAGQAVPKRPAKHQAKND